MADLFPDRLAERTIEKARALFGIENTKQAVDCIYHYSDLFHDKWFLNHKPSEVKLIKCVIYLLMTNHYCGDHKQEYMDYMKTH